MYILIRRIDGSILPTIRWVKLITYRHQTLGFFEPVEDPIELLSEVFFKHYLVFIRRHGNHQKPLAVRVCVVATERIAG